MNKQLELWRFISERLRRRQNVMLLLVAESSGSSPGRPGYKMAVASNGELTGSIGGGIMEVTLVNESREILSKPGAAAGFSPFLKPQVHQAYSKTPSGMICSGKQTVIFRLLTTDNLKTAETIIDALENHRQDILEISSSALKVRSGRGSLTEPYGFRKIDDEDFIFEEILGPKNELFIVGGGHCALALSELMSKMDFYIRLFDDRPELNTLDKNKFAHEIKIIDAYEQIGDIIPSGSNTYVVVMTLGYNSDEIVIRKLLDKDFKYFGVLGSKAKMKTLLKNLEKEGYAKERLAGIRAPIGMPIHSQTPEEIAVSIAAEIIAVKNSG